MRAADALVDVLRRQVLAHGLLHPGRWWGCAQAAQQAVLGSVEGVHHAGVVQGELQAAAGQVDVAHRLQQLGFEAQVFTQQRIELRQAMAHRGPGPGSSPAQRHQAIPGRAAQQIGRHLKRMVAVVVRRKRGVNKQHQRAKGHGPVALAQGAQHGQHKGRQRQHSSKRHKRRQGGPDRSHHQGEGAQCQQLRLQTPAPVVVGLGKGAGQHAQQQRHQRILPVTAPAQGQHAAKRQQGLRPTGNALVVEGALPVRQPVVVHAKGHCLRSHPRCLQEGRALPAWAANVVFTKPA